MLEATAAFAARKPMKRKRAKKRRDSRPRCDRNRCTKPARVTLEDGGWCVTHAKQLADKLCRAVVLHRDDYTCQSCGRTEAEGAVQQWCHIVTRGTMSLRYDLDNSLCMDSRCHYHYTLNPAAFETFISERYPGRWQELHTKREKAIADGPGIDYAEIIASLRSQAANL
jgi:hypothetical protein